jgi:acyl carrier protein
MERQLTYAQKIRDILSQHGRLPVPVERLADGADLYNAGLTSLATVGLMLALEDQLEIEFPDSMLGRKTFRSIEAIAEAVEQLRAK